MPLKDKVQVLQAQLGIESGLPAVQVVACAVEQLGLAEEVSGLPLVKKVDACMATLGIAAVAQVPSSSSSTSFGRFEFFDKVAWTEITDAKAATTAALRMQARFRGIQGRRLAEAQVAPTTLAGRCAILRRELGLSGDSIKDVVHTAATQLGVDCSDGRSLLEVAMACMEALGLEDVAED